MRAIERRSYLRISDTAQVGHRTVSEEATRKHSASESLDLDKAFGLRSQLYKLELEARELKREITETDQKLGSFLHNLNQRMEILTDVITNTDEQFTPNVIDLSPAGLSCISKDPYPIDDLLAIKLTFANVSLAVACYAKIRYSLLGEDDLYKIGIQFISLDDSTEGLLTRHIAALQAEERRQRLHYPDRY